MKKISIETARELSQSGEWIPNPNFGRELHPDAELPMIFRASYLIYWRPEPELEEAKQYALYTEA